jgi:hypothetical protein
MAKVTISSLMAEIETLKTKHVETTAKLEQSERYQKMYSESSSARDREIHELHSMLDMIPQCPPKKGEEGYDRKVTARLLGWLAAMVQK